MFLTLKKPIDRSIAIVFTMLLIVTATPIEAGELSPELIEKYTTTDPFSFILLEFGFIVMLALLGHIVSRLYQWPNMVAELVTGVVVGNLFYWLDLSPVFYMLMHMGDASDIFKSIWTSNLSVADTIASFYAPAESETKAFIDRLSVIFASRQSPALVLLGVGIWMFANFGAFFLLFKLGLETKPEDIIKSADPAAFLVSITGTLTPFFLGLGATFWLLPENSVPEHIFIAAALCTTSAAITMTMFKKISRLRTREALLVIQAARIDDIFGVFFLAFIANIVVGDPRSISETLSLFIYSGIVFLGIIVLGKWLVKYIPDFYSFDETHTMLLIPMMIVLMVSWLADIFEIGMVSSAFLAGVILNNLQDKRDTIKNIIIPLEKIFAPIFFVFVGLQVNLKQFLNLEIIGMTLIFLLIALLGKVIAGFVARQHTNPIAIGLGMIPRGEAVLIFISIGKILGTIDDTIFSVITMIVLLTNFIAPWAIDWFCTAKCQEESFVGKHE